MTRNTRGKQMTTSEHLLLALYHFLNDITFDLFVAIHTPDQMLFSFEGILKVLSATYPETLKIYMSPLGTTFMNLMDTSHLFGRFLKYLNNQPPHVVGVGA